MARTIRFYLDEHVAKAVRDGLRSRGVDVVSTQEAGQAGVADREQLAHALEQGRVLVTQDNDFLALAAEGLPHAGIVFITPRSASVARTIAHLMLIHEILEVDEIRGRVEFV